MSTRFLITLLCLPTLLGTLSFSLAASASETQPPHRPTKHAARPTSATTSCSIRDEKAAASGAAQKSGGDVMTLDFSAAASDAAVLLFGCDCPSCINALEQLRRPSLLAAAEGHCRQSISEAQDSDQVDDVLEAVDAAEAIGPDVPLPSDKF
ncbi:MAG: hypothetical protein ACFB5Z_19290 [Elainellaceae cyanobacterium]